MSLPIPKVSIITCFLDVENYIEATIQSVLQQEHKNWELLLVDDGSTDRSTLIAKQYASQYPDKIFYFEHEGHQNKGASLSRNVAIFKSSGEYIAFLDADDVWLPVYLKHQLNVLHQQKATMVCEASEYWHDWKEASAENIIIPVGAQQDTLFSPPQLMLDLYPLGSGAAPCICGMLIKREAILKHKGFDNLFTGMYDDQSLLVKLYLHESVYISSSVHNRYRQRSDSLVHTSHRSANYHKERKKFLRWLRAYLRSQHIKNPDIDNLLQVALDRYRFSIMNYINKAAPGKAKRIVAMVMPSSVKQYLKN